MNKIILITGASTGLGATAAVKLAKQGHTVIATMRNLKKQDYINSLAKQENTEIQLHQLDVQNTESINDCIEKVIADYGFIDVLINNAGVGFVRTTEQATEEEINWVMDVNFHGVVRCTKAVLPHMRERRLGHIINISSVGGLVGQPFNEIYCAAKFAVEGFAESLATYITPNFNIYFTNIEPGGIVSEFANSAIENSIREGQFNTGEYAPIMETFLASGAANPRGDLYQTCEEVAQVLTDSIKHDKPPFRLRTSSWSEEFTQCKTKLDPTGQRQIDLVQKELLA